MRLDDYRTSDNVEDQRGQGSGGSGFGGFGGGGGPIGLIISLVASRFGIGGVIVVGLLYFLFGGLFGGGGVQHQVAAPTQASAGRASGAAGGACATDAESKFSCQVLASDEDTWSKIFAQEGRKFSPATLVFYGGEGQSGCGAAQSAMGPFYCPTDNRIYLDTEFFQELSQRFHATGDFAQAYVVAHEYGHHIQFLLGDADRIREAQERASTAESNALQVKMELQADCYAGVWAAQNKDRLDPGDVEEGLHAASAIGDDTLQRETQGRVVPESFTHGTSAQRVSWLKRGIDTGDPAQCNTFAN